MPALWTSPVLLFADLPDEVLGHIAKYFSHWNIGQKCQQSDERAFRAMAITCKLLNKSTLESTACIDIKVVLGTPPFKLNRKPQDFRTGIRPSTARVPATIKFPDWGLMEELEERMARSLMKIDNGASVQSCARLFIEGVGQPSRHTQTFKAAVARVPWPYVDLYEDSRLGMNFTSCGDEGVTAIACTLALRQSGHHITNLDLRGNHCLAGGAVAVCAALASGACPFLTELDMGHNPELGSQAAHFLADCLEASPALRLLTVLGMERTGMDRCATAHVIAAATACLPNLRELHCGGNAKDLHPLAAFGWMLTAAENGTSGNKVGSSSGGGGG
eukprot:CAMPEP_0171805514 /NCGR_PEP_ID=MMETSP0991-20121206/74758_1 /TAXON_ID=483369 /ORGANISM="non described non described, Strain CCMP2098" /LENGTH=331 /DNA_ID=CAMNT_0012418105 /DNA_START=21 /DNA_END=1012 /DNA_ORIENTATION=+